jgi:SAM-dependent methyltransferase
MHAQSIRAQTAHAKHLIKGAAQRYPVLYRAMRGAYRAAGRVLPPRVLPGITGRVHRNDLMLGGVSDYWLNQYRAFGDSAANFVVETLSEHRGRSAEDVRACLDFGCGYGRVLRVLIDRFPNAAMSVCDLDADGARFCADEFGARMIPVQADVGRLDLQQYDVIWMGSVLTHLASGPGRDVMEVLAGHLRPEGILAFTTHGVHAIEHIDEFGPVAAEAAERIRSDVDSGGFAYLPYEHYRSDSYGLAWHSEHYVHQLAQEIEGTKLEVLAHRPDGWEGIQDLWAVGISGSAEG